MNKKIMCKHCGKELIRTRGGLCKSCYNKSYNYAHTKCMLCGKKITLTIPIGVNPKDMDMRRICQTCKDRDAPPNQPLIIFDERYHKGLVASFEENYRKIREKEREKMKHYKPGDPEFEKIAAQCTPPRNIKDKPGADSVPCINSKIISFTVSFLVAMCSVV